MQAIEIFRTGTHTDSVGATRRFGGPDLEAVAAGYDPALHEAPIVVGHPAGSAPAYGWVKGVRFVEDDGGGRLEVDPDQVDESFAELVRKGRFKKVSASFYLPDAPNNPTPGRYYLRHVGFLGAQPPAVKGLKPVAFGADEAGVVTFAEDADMTDSRPGDAQGAIARFFDTLARTVARSAAQPPAADHADDPKGVAGDGTGPTARRLIRRLQDAGMSLEDISDALGAMGEDASRSAGVLSAILREEIANPPDSLIEFLRRIEPPRRSADNEESDVSNIGKTLDDRATELSEGEKKLEAERKALEEEQAAFAEARAAARRADNESFLEELVEAGRFPPGLAAQTLDFMDTLEATEEAEFGEPSGKGAKGEKGPGTVKTTPLAFFREFLGKLPKGIDFAERAADDGQALDTADPERIAEAATAYQEEMAAKGIHVSADRAVRHVMKGADA